MYVVDSLMYAMGDPFTVDYQLGVCCTFAVGTKGHGRPWLRSCGHNMEFWVCNFGSFHFRGRKGIAHHCMPVGGTDEPIVLVCTAVCFGFLDPLCGIIPPTSVILSD